MDKIQEIITNSRQFVAEAAADKNVGNETITIETDIFPRSEQEDKLRDDGKDFSFHDSVRMAIAETADVAGTPLPKYKIIDGFGPEGQNPVVAFTGKRQELQKFFIASMGLTTLEELKAEWTGEDELFKSFDFDDDSYDWPFDEKKTKKSLERKKTESRDFKNLAWKKGTNDKEWLSQLDVEGKYELYTVEDEVGVVDSALLAAMPGSTDTYLVSIAAEGDGIQFEKEFPQTADGWKQGKSLLRSMIGVGVNESKERLLKKVKGNDGRVVKIYKDTDNGEFVCKLFVNGKHTSKDDYFTDDKKDATTTAKDMVKESYVRPVKEASVSDSSKYPLFYTVGVEDNSGDELDEIMSALSSHKSSIFHVEAAAGDGMVYVAVHHSKARGPGAALQLVKKLLDAKGIYVSESKKNRRHSVKEAKAAKEAVDLENPHANYNYIKVGTHQMKHWIVELSDMIDDLNTPGARRVLSAIIDTMKQRIA